MPKYIKEGPRKHKWVIRREEALERQEYWESLTPTQQLDNLNDRLGDGVGATKQRSRIIRNALKRNKKGKRKK